MTSNERLATVLLLLAPILFGLASQMSVYNSFGLATIFFFYGMGSFIGAILLFLK